MKYIIGRDPACTNIQTPPQFGSVSRAHASLVFDASGQVVLEDLGSSHGTFVFDGRGWQRITRMVIHPATPILLADFRTTAAELVGSQHTLPGALPLAAGVAQPPPHPIPQPMPHAAPAGAAAGENLDRLPLELLLRTAGIGDLVRILTTLHNPLRGIRELIAEPNKALYQAILAYIAIVAMIPFLHKEVIMRIGTMVGYPVVAQGDAIENAFVVNVVAAISSVIGFGLMYALPVALYRPSTRTLVVASNIYTSLYVLIYNTAADLLKFAQYALTKTFEISIGIGLVMMLFGLAFQIYVWRRIMALRWGPIVVFMVIGLAFGFLHGYALARMGLIKYAGAGG